MPGQCYGCAVQFGVFKKEHGCKNCGFAFCSKCLHPKTIRVPKRDNAKHHVCDKCYRILSGEVTTESTEPKYELPQAYLKRVEALKERDSHESCEKKGVGTGQKVPAHIRKLDKPDQEIAMRLERLRDADKPKEKVTDADIRARLANLQGQQYRPDKKPAYRPPDRRLQGQQVDDLLDEIAAEIEIDAQTDPAKDIETRLENLRHDDKKQNSQKQPDGNNLNKEASSDVKKNTGYNKNIGNTGGAAGSSEGIDMEEMQRLIEKTAAELDVDAQAALSGMQKDKELMARLKEIQKKKDDKESNKEKIFISDGATSGDENSSTMVVSDDNSEEDEDKAAARIIQRYLEESKIDDRVTNSQGGAKASRHQEEIGPPTIKPPSRQDILGDDDYEDKSELPFCCICTEDAVIRCKDCDMDLFCQRCFRECHREMEMDDHRTTPYKAPKGYH